MNAICKYKCFFRGRSTFPGEVFDLTPIEAKSDLVKSSFACEFDPSEALKTLSPDAELTSDEYRRRLTEMGLAFKARDDKATLAKIYAGALAPVTSIKA
jgi:hypothetical protein